MEEEEKEVKPSQVAKAPAAKQEPEPEEGMWVEKQGRYIYIPSQSLYAMYIHMDCVVDLPEDLAPVGPILPHRDDNNMDERA